MEGSLSELGVMSFKNSVNFDWWSLGTAVVLTIAVALLVFSLLPEMASEDLTAKTSPDVTRASTTRVGV